jgi:hypothetical protein
MTVSLQDDPHEMTHFIADSIFTEVGVRASLGHITKKPTVGLGVPGMRTEVKVCILPLASGI